MFKHKWNMGFKTLTIKEKVYRKLLKAKQQGESFSDLFERLVSGKKQGDIMRFAGILGHLTDEEVAKRKKSYDELWEGFERDLREREKRWWKK